MQGFFHRLIALHRPLVNALNALLGEYGLSYSLWQVMLFLKTNGAATLVEMAEYYNIEKPSVTRRAQSLEEKQLIEVMVSEDRREKKIRLTSSGIELYNICREKITELELRSTASLSNDEKSTLFEALPKVTQSILNEKRDNLNGK